MDTSTNILCSEEKIIRIESRLASIEQLLRQFLSTGSFSSPQQTPVSSYNSNTHTSHIANASDPEHDSNVQTPATGAIGLCVESVAAKNAFEHTISQDSTVQQDPQLSSALASLRRIVERTQFDRSASSTDLTSNSLAKCTLDLHLGWEQIRTLLKKAEGPLFM